MKDNEFRELVNTLRDVATQYHDHESLRERIRRALSDALKNQVPIAYKHRDGMLSKRLPGGPVLGIDWTPLYAAPVPQAPSVPDGWVNPNDKTQRQYLPHIGQPVLFCHGGTTYYGKHTGGSFTTGQGATARNFITWDCLWMPLPAAPQPERSECSWQETSARRPELEQTIVVQRANGRLFIGVYDEHFCQPRCVDRWTGKFVSGFDLWFAVPDCAERSAGDEREGE